MNSLHTQGESNTTRLRSARGVLEHGNLLVQRFLKQRGVKIDSNARIARVFPRNRTERVLIGGCLSNDEIHQVHSSIKIRWTIARGGSCIGREKGRDRLLGVVTRERTPRRTSNLPPTLCNTQAAPCLFLDRMWIMRYLKPRPAVWSVAHLFDFSPFEQIFDSRHRETVERLAGLPYRACVSDTKSWNKHRYEIACNSFRNGVSPREIYSTKLSSFRTR